LCSDYGSIHTQFDKTTAPPVRVLSDGACQWFLPGRFSTPCRIDITSFPFDYQTCPLIFQSWSYDTLQLNLTRAYDVVDIDAINGGWNLLGSCSSFLVCFYH